MQMIIKMTYIIELKVIFRIFSKLNSDIDMQGNLESLKIVTLMIDGG